MRATARRTLKLSVVVAMVTATLGLSAFSAGAATEMAVIDFESGLASGDIVSLLDVGTGITGTDAGDVPVDGTRSTLPGVNQAMIFDANCGGSPATCTGEDSDLYQPTLGNVLIISEDGDTTDPDDADVGELFTFDFSGWGPTGVVTVVSIDVLDVEAVEASGANIDVDGSSVAIPEIGDGNFQTVDVGLTGTTLQVVLNGSGAIDNIRIQWDVPDDGGGEGCTPGYWKQPHHFDSWTGYSPGDSFDTVFGGAPVDYNKTLLEALEQGGGQEKALGRHAVAALLNASSPDVSYEYTASEVIDLVRDAWSGAEDIEYVKDLFEAENEAGCPLN